MRACDVSPSAIELSLEIRVAFRMESMEHLTGIFDFRSFFMMFYFLSTLFNINSF